MKTDDLILFAFDLLFDGDDDLRPLPLSERKDRLKAYLPAKSPRIRYVDHFQAAGDAVLQSACRMSLEGIVSKRLDAPYRSGRSDTWTKAKCRAGHEVVIGGWSGEAGQVRSLMVGVNRGEHLTRRRRTCQPLPNWESLLGTARRAGSSVPRTASGRGRWN